MNLSTSINGEGASWLSGTQPRKDHSSLGDKAGLIFHKPISGASVRIADHPEVIDDQSLSHLSARLPN